MATTPRVRIYLDDKPQPIVDEALPADARLDTLNLADGPHRLIVRARDQTGREGYEEIPFKVHNGPGIVVSGLRPNSIRRGEIRFTVDGFSADDPFDPRRAEARSSIPVWVWVMSLFIVAWTVWYGANMWEVPSEFANTPTYSRDLAMGATITPQQTAPVGAASTSGAVAGGETVTGGADVFQGKQLYDGNCAACHQTSGKGLPGAFPSLEGNAVITAADPSEHIRVVLFGLQGKAIDGVNYSSPMPAWGSQFNDQQIADIISYERGTWGNHGKPVSAKEVAAIRANGK